MVALPALREVLAGRDFRRLFGVRLVGQFGDGLLQASLATFVLFYLMTVFSLSWATSKLGYSRERYLEIQLIGVAFFAATIPLAAWLTPQLRESACGHFEGRFGSFFDLRIIGG